MTVDNFAELIKYVCSTKHIEYTDMKTRFANFPICLMEYIEKDVYEKVVEIRFDDYKSTLSATFDKKDICDYIVLFPDQIENIDQLFLYLSENYDYDFLKGSWILSNCYMNIKEDKEGIIFIFRY